MSDVSSRAGWREEVRKHPIKSCGRLDMETYMPDEVTVGRVTSANVRYVYMEDGSEVVCLGTLCDHVAFRAADYDAALAAKDAEIGRLEEECRLLRGAMRADDERLRVAELRVNGDPALTMGCDAPDWLAEKILEQRAEIGRLREQKDGAYTERNALVAALSKLLPSFLSRHPAHDLEWDDDWRWIVFIFAPAGQLSWHIHDSESAAFDHLEVRVGEWDGHTTPEKYARLAALEGPPRIECDSCGGEFVGDALDSTCRGCERVICRSCCDVFEHFGGELHGTGDPAAEVDRLRRALKGGGGGE